MPCMVQMKRSLAARRVSVAMTMSLEFIFFLFFFFFILFISPKLYSILLSTRSCIGTICAFELYLVQLHWLYL